MTTRRMWTAIPGLAVLAVGAFALSAYSGASSPQGRGPAQPIAFPHPVHVQKLGMNCLYCHYSANKSPDPGLPAVSTCMGCHTIIGPQRPASD
ncbi:MAG: cytochrome c3 family protein, partial [Gemmatimonadaceae bacterium]